MSFSSPPRPAGNCTTPQVSLSGNGATEPTAQYTYAFSQDTTQRSYTVYRMLESVKWLRCTLDEAKYYRHLNYQVYKANGQSFRSPGTEAPAGEVNLNAFHHHFEDVVEVERALETAGVEATRDEGLKAGAADQADQADSFSESPESSEDVFDKPQKTDKSEMSPRDKGKGTA